jgi:hypothetical protein
LAISAACARCRRVALARRESGIITTIIASAAAIPPGIPQRLLASTTTRTKTIVPTDPLSVHESSHAREPRSGIAWYLRACLTAYGASRRGDTALPALTARTTRSRSGKLRSRSLLGPAAMALKYRRCPPSSELPSHRHAVCSGDGPEHWRRRIELSLELGTPVQLKCRSERQPNL